MKVAAVVLVFLAGVMLTLLIADWLLLGPAGESKEVVIFVVPQDKSGFDIASALQRQKLIKNSDGFEFLVSTIANGREIKSGGYKLNPGMNAWQVLARLTGKQDLVWVTISFCPRKEQVGEKLSGALGWSQEDLTKWNTVYTNTKPEYFEGVYYPDTYLLPVDESGAQIADRFINRFNEKFAPLADQFAAKNIKWTTGLKIASLIAREAGGEGDMKIVSGIIWNRLDADMPLQIDATMQYTLGKINGSWWGAIDLSEKQKDSPYNSYLHKGLPPTPICSPNIDYLEAVLNPDPTDCIYYLHDSLGEIHCAKTYNEHKANIEKYLRD